MFFTCFGDIWGNFLGTSIHPLCYPCQSAGVYLQHTYGWRRRHIHKHTSHSFSHSYLQFRANMPTANMQTPHRVGVVWIFAQFQVTGLSNGYTQHEKVYAMPLFVCNSFTSVYFLCFWSEHVYILQLRHMEVWHTTPLQRWWREWHPPSTVIPQDRDQEICKAPWHLHGRCPSS